MSDRRQVVGAAVVAVGLLGLTLWPLTRHPRADGFPFSTYPMFATTRPRLQAVHHAVVRPKAGDGVAARPALLGTDEVMQAAALVRKAVAAGPVAAEQLCAHVARRVAASDDPADAPAAEVEIRTDTFDAVAYFAGDRRPRASQVHARCRVQGRGS